MDLRQLRYFVAIVEQGSFTKAAEALGIAQPALSARISTLEDELQLQLLVRHSRGVSPTAQGEFLLAKAREILEDVETTRNALIAGANAPRGRVCLGITPSNDVAMTTRIVRECHARLPDIRLSVVEGISGDVVEWVASGRADLGLVYWGHADTPGISVEALASEALVFVERLPETDPTLDSITLAEVCEHPLILATAPHIVRSRIEEAAQRLAITPSVPFEMQSIATIFEMVKQGLGCSVLPAGAVSHLLDTRHLNARRIVEPALELQLSLIRPSAQEITHSAAEVGKLIARIYQTRVS